MSEIAVGPPWQSRRSALNHDWLSSVFPVEIGNWENIIDDRVDADSSVGQFRRAVLVRWKEKAAQIRRLVDDFESAMSPAEFCVGRLPIENPDYTWLRDLSVALWRVRNTVRPRVARILRSLDTAEAQSRLVEAALSGLSETSSLVGVERVRKQVGPFRDACSDLSDAIHDLPSRVLIA